MVRLVSESVNEMIVIMVEMITVMQGLLDGLVHSGPGSVGDATLVGGQLPPMETLDYRPVQGRNWNSA
jgi:hypothetical protein